MDYRDVDREIWEDELEEFVPKRVFDAHCTWSFPTATAGRYFPSTNSFSV